MSQKSTYLSGVKTIHHQSFTILSQLYIQKHAMIIVKTSREDFETSIKLSAENSLSVLPLIIKAIAHTFSFTNITKIQKKFLKNSKLHVCSKTTRVYTLFILKYFSITQQKHLLIILLSRSFFMLSCSKASLVEKSRLCRNGETRIEIQDERN